MKQPMKKGFIMPLAIFVDDSQTVLSAVKLAISDMPIETKFYTDATQALADFRSGLKPDLIVTDLNMPIMNGFEFLSEIRNLESTATVPVLILTTESSPQMKEKGKALHATGWIVKPFNTAQFKQAISRVLRLR
jgi:two-component system chemotaxis response regulator CheY